MKRCVYLSAGKESLAEDKYDHFVRKEFTSLEKAFARKGWKLVFAEWEKSLPSCDAVIIRTTWDYYHKVQPFLARMEEISREQPVFFNPLAQVRWNADKRYLQDLAAKDVPVVPTLWIEAGGVCDMDAWFSRLDAKGMVVKPVVSAGSFDTYRISYAQKEAMRDTVEKLVQKADVMVQPFMRHIVDEGEFSYVFFNGRLSHALLKTPAKGDFRSQPGFGSTIRSVLPQEDELSQASAVLHALEEMPLYARVDMVRGEDSRLHLMELELIEPYLYLDMAEESAPDYFVTAFLERIAQKQAA